MVGCFFMPIYPGGENIAFTIVQNFPESRNEGGEEAQGTRQVLIGSHSRKKAPQEKNCGACLVGVTVILEVREEVGCRRKVIGANFPCSYGTRQVLIGSHSRKKAPQEKNLRGFFGRSDWIRTSGLLVPNQALYQTEPHPVLTLKNTAARRPFFKT